MNAQSHRLIFNPSRGCLMAVAETSRRCGKSGASGTTRSKRTRCRRGADIQASNRHLDQLNTAQAAINSVAIDSNVTADQDITLSAANNITVDAATNTQRSTRYSALSESGLMNSGDMSATIGTRDQSTDTQPSSSTAAASTIGSVGGNVNILAGNTYTQRGSDVVATNLNALLENAPASAGNVDITAKKLDIVEAREAFTTSTEQKFSQTGVTLAIQNSAVQGAQTVQSMDQSMTKTKSARMKALGAASAAMAAKEALGSDATNVSASLTFGTSQSESKTSFTSNTARGSSMNAAGNATLKATGAGQNSNLAIQGSTVKAGDTTTLEADNEVQLLAAANTTTQTSSQKSSSASASTDRSKGVGFTGSASMASGAGNGSETSYTNTQLRAGKKAIIKSGADTTVKGAVVEADTIQADVGGNLKVESLQDTSRYNESSQSASVSGTIGPKPAGSLSLGGTKIDSNYKSVTQQSALKAGDGGFQVNVTGNTDLKGGAITSSQKAIDDNKNTFQTARLTTSDIQNSASFKADSYAVTVGSSGGSAGMGQDSGSASSSTKAGISGIAGNKAARTGDAETGIQKIFDANKVKDEVNAQVAITQEFGKQAPKAVASFADSQRTDLLKQFQAESDPTKRAQLSLEAKKWEEGGTYRVLMHTTLGGLGGGTAGGLGAGAAAVAAPLMNEMQSKLTASLMKTGLSQKTAEAISTAVTQTTVLATATALGGTNSGAMALNVDANNRQLHPKETERIKQLAGGDKQKEARLAAAACAMVHCADGVPKDDPNYATLKSLQDLGAGLTDEKALLNTQTAYISRNPNAKLFGYTGVDEYLIDPATQNKVGTRLAGATQGTLGTAGVAGSGALCTTGLGCVAGAVTGTVSLDYAQAGFRQAVTGNAKTPAGEQVLQSLGLSPQAAAYTYAVLGLAPAAVDAVVANSAMNQTAKLNLATREANTTTAANEARQIVPNPFTTKGVVFREGMIQENPAVRSMYNDYLAALSGNAETAKRLTIQAVQSGETLPVVRIIGRNEELVRLVPVGNDAGISSFYMSRPQYDMLIGTGKNAQQVAEALGLPASSYSAGGFRGFQAVSIQAQPGKIATAYETTIAPIEQGAFTAQGQMRQLVVPNLKDFTAPKPIPNGVIAPAGSR